MAINGLSIVISVFIAILIGIILVGVVADDVSEMDDILSATNESITIASGTGTTTNDDLTGVSYFGNLTNSTDQSAFSINTHVNWTTAGVITVGYNISGAANNESAFSDGNYNISYTYQGDMYVANSTARTITDLVIIFFVLAILAIGVPMAMRIAPDLFK